MNLLEIGAQIAEIGTAIVAVSGGILYAVSISQKRRALEQYLKAEKDANPRRYAKDGKEDHGRRTVLHLIAALKMSEEEILRAAFRSKRIHPSPATGEHGRAEAVYLEYKEETTARLK